MDAPFHAGELEIQRRAGVLEEARRVAAIGLLFVDFAGGGVLQLRGRASVGDDRSVEVTIEEVRETPAACPLRYDFVDYSPVNPRGGRLRPPCQRSLARSC
jgi:hypothetical protein